jgi:ketosteroid isomerase-like protein
MIKNKKQYAKIKINATQMTNDVLIMDLQTDIHCGSNFYVTIWESIFNDPKYSEMKYCIETALQLINNKKNK